MPQSDIPVFNLTNLQDWDPLLERLYEGLYTQSFPDPDEREDLAQWRRRLTDPPESPDPRTATFVIGAELQDFASVERKIQGFLTVEYFRRSRCGLASYIAIEPVCRGRGWARLLFSEGKKWLNEQCQEQNLRALFAEVHDPHKPGDPRYPDPLDPYQRLEVMGRLGAKWVGLPYWQPPLTEGRNWVEFLLMAFPVNDGPLETLDVKVVKAFLHEYYRALRIAAPEKDDHLQKTFSNIEQEKPLSLVKLVLEPKPLLSFREYSVAMHFIDSPDPENRLLGIPTPSQPIQTDGEPRSDAAFKSDPVFESFERDELSFLHRADRRWGEGDKVVNREGETLRENQSHAPFSSQRVRDELTQQENRFPLEIRFPEVLAYLAEGENKRLLSSTRGRRVRLSASKTVFHGKANYKTAVLHLVFTPDGTHGDRAILNEWDLVKLIKFWEGGEGVDDPGSEEFIQKHVEFVLDEGSFTLDGLVEKVFQREKERKPWRPQCGTVQLLTSSETTPDWNDLYKLCYRCRKGLDENKVTQELIAVAGIIQGLLDFRDVDKSELADVFKKEFRYEKSMLLGIHKGTLFEFTSKCRVYDKLKENVGANPYLLLPNSVLCYNECLLRQADAASKLSRLEEAIRIMRDRLQNRFLGNVFHYPTTRLLYDYGMQSRGLLDFEKHLLRKLEELESKWRRSIEEQERTYQKKVQAGQRLLAGIALVFTVFGGVSAVKAFNDLFREGLHAPGPTVAVVCFIFVILFFAYLKFEEDSR